ncbi:MULTISPECIES: C-terminal binding protein [unclassified Sedimentibacter]|uniref:C-terminal binding protein n=1 Tax=unclassified Sedimentibacter TaxID=2649220 RepID=UPI0027E1BD05|nr:C-terminal binding protein [Sedimentibacter sp. MB35-C1]WMJ77545.1 C-terminal binding protein [Sedimentibacter sp. MB35-C1]
MEVIITDCDHKNIDIETTILNNAKLSFKLLQCKTEKDLINNCKGANILINQYAPITETVMKSLLPELKQVVRYGVGVDNINLEAAKNLGIIVCNVPDYGMNEVADHALTLMLALERKIVLMSNYTKNTKWDYTKSIPIHRHNTLTVGIIGYGRIGKEFAKRVNALGCNIVVSDPKSSNYNTKTDSLVKFVSMDELLEKSDVISIHCPLDNNVGLFNDEAFDKMKNTAYIINTARGGIINEDALDRALTEGKIAGAALDVVKKEPLNTEAPLFRHENFICTPHMAWYSEEAALELKRKVAEEAVRFARGEECFYPVNFVLA